MVLAQKQPQRSVEQNREPVNKPLHMHSTSILQRSQEYSVEEKQSLQQKVLEKLDKPTGEKVNLNSKKLIHNGL